MPAGIAPTRPKVEDGRDDLRACILLCELPYGRLGIVSRGWMGCYG